MSNIKVGDLVVIVRPMHCCGNAQGIGKIYSVNFISEGAFQCLYCKAIAKDTYACGNRKDKDGMPIGVEIDRLKRIDPLPESETQDNHESLPA